MKMSRSHSENVVGVISAQLSRVDNNTKVVCASSWRGCRCTRQNVWNAAPDVEHYCCRVWIARRARPSRHARLAIVVATNKIFTPTSTHFIALTKICAQSHAHLKIFKWNFVKISLCILNERLNAIGVIMSEIMQRSSEWTAAIILSLVSFTSLVALHSPSLRLQGSAPLRPVHIPH